MRERERQVKDQREGVRTGRQWTVRRPCLRQTHNERTEWIERKVYERVERLIENAWRQQNNFAQVPEWTVYRSETNGHLQKKAKR